MTNYSSLFKAMSSLHSQHREPEYTAPLIPFPLKQIYPQQQNLLIEMKDSFTTAALTSHTGAGKTPVFLSLTRGKASLIIEPRKFLQKQCATYYNDFILFGRSEYPCQYSKNAANAPCNRKVTCETTNYHKTCDKATKTCLERPCKVFGTEQTHVKYPCLGCQYLKAQTEAKQTLQKKGTVICNFGNFWQLLKSAEFVVIDEADLFFREIAKPTRLEYSTPKIHENDSIKDLLTREEKGLMKALGTSPASQVYSIQNKMYNASFLLSQQELCFKYQRKDKIYIEINPENVGVLKDKIFQGKTLLLVSATLPDFNIPEYSYSVWQRRGIFYAPVGKMTSRELKMKPWLMGRAAEQIDAISSLAEGLYDTNQFVVHCGNIGTHATQLNELLNPELCTLHERGNIMKTIEDFIRDGKRYLLVASAEYGADFGWCKVQYILKFPYASLDERMRVLERTMGKNKFNQFYLNDARTRFIQQAGRNCRGFGDFGATIVMDAKFMEDYKSNSNLYPPWFRSGMDPTNY